MKWLPVSVMTLCMPGAHGRVRAQVADHGWPRGVAKACAAAAFAVLLAPCPLSADAIIMDNNETITGTVLEKTDSSVFIQTSAGKEEISTKYIKRIIVDNGTTARAEVPVAMPEQSDPASDAGLTPVPAARRAAARDAEWVLKAGLDLNGSHKALNGLLQAPGYYDYTFESDEKVNTGISVAGEYVSYLNANLGFGAGASYLLPRRQTDIEGAFSFTPLYALARVRTTPDAANNYLYLLGQLGYSLFSGDDKYTGVNATLTGGLYYGVGAGFTRGNVQVELLYSRSSGKLSQSIFYYDTYYRRYQTAQLSADIGYTQITFSFGYRFKA